MKILRPEEFDNQLAELLGLMKERGERAGRVAADAANAEAVYLPQGPDVTEWVEEAPSGGRGGVLPLSNFGTIQFSDGSTVKDGQAVSIAATGARAITMVSNNDQALAVPSPLGSDGRSFSVARTDVAVIAPAGGGRLGRGGP